MRLSTCIIRSPFGVSNAQMAGGIYQGQAFEMARERTLKIHMEKVVDQVQYLPGALLHIDTSHRERGPSDIDGREGEWWSILTWDGPNGGVPDEVV